MEEREFTLVDCLALLAKYKRLILSGTFVVVAGALALNLMLSKVYQTSVLILYSKSKVPSAKEAAQEGVNTLNVKTVEGMLSNVTLAEKAIARFNLGKDPYRLTPFSFIGDHLMVQELKGTNLIRMSFELSDPKLAVAIVNFFAEQAVELTQNINNQDTIRAREYVRSQLENARKEYENSRAEFSRFSQADNILSLRKEREALTERLLDLQANEAAMRQFLRNVKAVPARERLDALEAKYRELLRKGNYDYLRSRRDSILKDIQSIFSEARKAESDLGFEKGKVKQLEAELAKLKRVEVVSKSVLDKEPGLYAVAQEKSQSKGGSVGVQLKSEEFNPVFQKTELDLILSRTRMVSLEGLHSSLLQRRKKYDEELAKVEEKLSVIEAERVRLARDIAVAKGSWSSLHGFEEGRGNAEGMARATRKDVRFTGSVQEAEELLGVVDSEIQSVTVRLADIQKELAQKESRLEKLKSDFERSKKAYDLYAAKFDEIFLSATSGESTLRIVESALVPNEPIKPRIVRNTVVSGAVGLFLLSFLVLSLEGRRLRGLQESGRDGA